MRKPRGFSVIGEAEALGFLAEQPVTLIWGVGKAFAATLERDGIRMIGQLQTLERGELMRRYGVDGRPALPSVARAGRAARCIPTSDAKSVSAETTFDTDLASPADLVPVLRALSEKVSARLKKAGIAGRTVVLKLKTQDFKLRTRNRQLGDPTRLADRIFQTGLHLLEKETDGTKYRLLGIGVSDLSGSGKGRSAGSGRRAVAQAGDGRRRDRQPCAKNSAGRRSRPATLSARAAPRIRRNSSTATRTESRWRQPVWTRSAQVDLAGHDVLAGLRVDVDGGQLHAVLADLLDGHARFAVAVDVLGPTDAEIDGVALAVAAKTRRTGA